MIDDTLAEIEAELKALKTSTPAKKAALKRKLGTLKRELSQLRREQQRKVADMADLAESLRRLTPPELTHPKLLETVDDIARRLAALGI